MVSASTDHIPVTFDSSKGVFQGVFRCAGCHNPIRYQKINALGFIGYILGMNVRLRVIDNGVPSEIYVSIKEAHKIIGNVPDTKKIGSIFARVLHALVNDAKAAEPDYELSLEAKNVRLDAYALFGNLPDPYMRAQGDAGLLLAQEPLQVITGEPGDDTEAAKLYERLAKQGDARAQFNVAIMYLNGRGVAKDTSKAVDFCRKAADNGYAIAQFHLAVMYVRGLEIGKSEIETKAEAFRLCQLSAKNGYAKAQYNLGLLFAHGYLVPQDYKQAVALYKCAAVQNYPAAQHNLTPVAD